MRKIIFILIYFFSISSWGVSEAKIKVQPSNTVSNEVLRAKIDSLIKLQREQRNLVYEQRIQQATETIANQNSLITGFSTLYTVMTILLALIGISLPILTYQFGIKPSQKALKEFQDTSDIQFQKFLAANRNRQIEQAIANIKDNSLESKNNALNYLSLTTYEGFTNSQIDEMISLLYSNDIDSKTKSSIAYTITSRQHPSSTNYFRKVFEENLQDQFISAITYFKNINSVEYFDSLATLLAKSDKQSNDFLLFSTYISQQSSESLILYLNCTAILDVLTQETLKSIKLVIKVYKRNAWKITDEEFNNSYLLKKVNASG